MRFQGENNMKNLNMRFLVLLLLLSISAPFATVVSAKDASNLRNDMRRLWEDHIIYTRNFIVSFAGNLPDQDAVSARLMKNQEDIGNAISSFYRDAAGTQLTALL